ncbi:MAG: hypothetical protein K6G61_11140 [Solobacterium sp.]|nr:hypothetical protein [Solobacterium sp.]
MVQIKTTIINCHSEKEFTALYQCSHCLNPVIRRFALSVTMPTTLLHAKRVQQEVEKEFAKWETKLQEHMNDSQEDIFTIGKPYMAMTRKLTGLSTPCPVCGSKEPWQESETIWKKQAAFPVQFCTDLCEGFESAKSLLRKRVVEAERVQADSQKYSAAVLQYDRSAAVLQSLKNELDNSQVIMRYRKLRQETEDAEARIKQLGAFSSEKRQLQKTVNANQIELKNSEAEYMAEFSRIELEAMEAEKKYTEAGYLLKKYAGQAVMKENDEAIALALCEENCRQEAGELVSLSLLPKCGRTVRSPFEKNNVDKIDLIVKLSQGNA